MPLNTTNITNPLCECDPRCLFYFGINMYLSTKIIFDCSVAQIQLVLRKWKGVRFSCTLLIELGRLDCSCWLVDELVHRVDYPIHIRSLLRVYFEKTFNQFYNILWIIKWVSLHANKFSLEKKNGTLHCSTLQYRHNSEAMNEMTVFKDFSTVFCKYRGEQGRQQGK